MLLNNGANKKMIFTIDRLYSIMKDKSIKDAFKNIYIHKTNSFNQFLKTAKKYLCFFNNK